jgi:hypothetical protein
MPEVKSEMTLSLYSEITIGLVSQIYFMFWVYKMFMNATLKKLVYSTPVTYYKIFCPALFEICRLFKLLLEHLAGEIEDNHEM